MSGYTLGVEIHALYYLDKKLILSGGKSYILGRGHSSDVLLAEKTVSRDHARLRFSQGGWVVTDLESTNGTVVNHERIKKRKKLKDGDHITIGPFVCVYRHFLDVMPEMEEFDSLLSDTLQVERRIKELLDQAAGMSEREKIHGFKHYLNGMRQRLNTMANVDRLTGLFNRRYLDQQLSFELERAGRYNHPLSLLLIDIDRFKQFNDTHGHQKGDEVLATVGAIVAANTRANDLAARYGGEEMAVILPETPTDQAALAAEKLRRRIEKESEARTKLRVTVSIGVAGTPGSLSAQPPGQGPVSQSDSSSAPLSPALLIEAADTALYKAKELGRNQVVVA